MRIILLCLFTIALIIAALVEDPFLLFTTGTLILGYCALILKDLSGIKKICVGMLNTAANNQTLTFATPRTSSGLELQTYCEALKFRFNTLHNAIEDLNRLQRVQGTASIAPAICDEEQLYEHALKFAVQYLNCFAAALIVDAGSKDQRVFSYGIKGERFEKTLLNVIGNRLNTPSFEKFREDDDESFSNFGLKQSLCLPLKWQEDSAVRSGALWFGYSSERPITESEEKLAEEIQKKVSVELTSRWLVCELGQKVQEAESISKGKSDLMKHVSHDIRSPLNNIKAVLNLLQIEGTPSDSSKILEMGLRNCDAMLDIVENIMDLSKFNAGKLVPQKQTVHLAEEVKSVVEAYQIAAKVKGVTLTQTNSDLENSIVVDPHHLKRIAANLISNALKYTPKGHIEVDVYDDKEGTVLSVRDSGIGISTQQLQSLFTPFSRFEPHLADGVGLGLTLTKILVEMNGGKISVRSAQNKGTVVVVTFPTQGKIVKDKEKPSLYENICKKVLVVDNDADSVLSLGRVLERYGYEVSTAISVDNACAQLERDLPDILLTDSDMPNGGGRRILDFIATKGLDLKTVVISGEEEDELKTKFRGVNVDTFLIKPVDIQGMVRILHSLSGYKMAA